MKSIGGSRHIGSSLDPNGELMANSLEGRLSSLRSRRLSKIAETKNPSLGRCLQLKIRMKVNDHRHTAIWILESHLAIACVSRTILST